ncbi:hypothetical protein SmJEL517_g01071 [Synchytrium microbalum]|uniref:Uncharacterized protein n=1 Tax=Synchytrium microbalum TaxID=1806994 RepID=A0A507CGS6_9FUNG|nr:uncharacterized protein SmJEL517_g01071 [Synchytrium microbalum]TPX37184.1 hypothetical protein SmJEL517_g01071 [Synchytrium microbalum]
MDRRLPTSNEPFEKRKRKTNARSLPTHALPKQKHFRSSHASTTSNNNTTVFEPKTPPALYSLIPKAEDILQVGSPSTDSLLLMSTRQNTINNQSATTTAYTAPSHNSSRTQESFEYESGASNTDVESNGASNAISGNTTPKHQHHNINSKHQPKHAFLPWRTSQYRDSGQEDSDDEDYVYPEDDHRRKSTHHQYQAVSASKALSHLYAPDSPFMTGQQPGLLQQQQSQLLVPPYNAYPADPHISQPHQYRYATRHQLQQLQQHQSQYDSDHSQSGSGHHYHSHSKRHSPDAYASGTQYYSPASGVVGYGSTSGVLHHQHQQQQQPPHNPYYNEFPIPENIDPERVRLLSKHAHHHHPSDLIYWGDGSAGVYHQHIRSSHSSNRILRPAPALVLTLVLLVLTGFPLLFLCVRPLDADGGLFRVRNINASTELYEFDVTMSASNPNIVPVHITEVDLDILVSAHLPNTRSSPASRKHKGGDSQNPSTEELLGHIKYLSSSITIPAWVTTNNATGHVSMPEPSNTLGKLIYMLGTYELQIVGTLTYHTVFVVPYTVPVCTIHRVERGKVKKTFACTVDDDDGGIDEGDGEDSNDIDS